MSFQDHSAPPRHVDRVIVHQFDPARPSPGGIDTCLRGVCRYLPVGTVVAVVGVDTGAGPSTREVGKWERYRLGEQEFWFLPVTSLDPADQARRIPHVFRVLGGILRHRRRIPARATVQVHRMDTAAALRFVLPGAQLYCIHTQENGLVGRTSDSFWRFLGGAHQALERSVVRNATDVVVFNEDYARTVAQWNPRTVFSPTWFDPALIDADGAHDASFAVLWVGRLEVPKDPILAIKAFSKLIEQDPANPWTLHMLGSGTLEDDVRAAVRELPIDVQDRVTVHGRVAPADVAHWMARADLFLMTSFPGYEGYPRVLVEAMASGLPAVVTQGSDTGGIVADATTGYTCSREPAEIATALMNARQISRSTVAGVVAAFDAPTLVGRMLQPEPAVRNEESVR